MAERLKHAAREAGKAAATVALAFGLVFNPMTEPRAQDKSAPPAAQKAAEQDLAAKSTYIAVLQNRLKLTKAVEEKGAAQEQKDALLKASDAALAGLDLYENLHLSENLIDLIEKPEFKVEMLDTVTLVLKKTSEGACDSINAIDWLLETEAGPDPEMLALFNLIIEKNNENAGKALWALYYVVSNQNFGPGTLGAIKAIVEKNDENALYLLHLLDKMLGNPNFKADMLDTEFAEILAAVVTTIDKKSGDKSPYTLTVFGNLVEKKGFKPEMLNKVFAEDFLETTYVIEEKTGKNAEYGLAAFGAFVGNPNFTLEMFNKDLAGKFADTVNLIVQKTGGNAQHVADSFMQLSYSSRFKPGMIDVVDVIIEKTAANTKYGLNFFEASLLRLSFSQKALDKNFAEQFAEMVNVIAEKTGANEKHALEVFGWLAENSNFGSEMFNKDFAINFAEIVNLVIEKSGKKQSGALFDLCGIVRHGSFEPEMLAGIKTIVEKTDKNAPHALSVLLTMGKHGSLKLKMLESGEIGLESPVVAHFELLKKESAAKLADSINIIVDKNQADPYPTLLEFAKVLKSPKFKPPMLVAINIIMEKTDKNSAYALIAFDGLLRNPKLKTETVDKELAENFAHIVNFIAEKQGENAKYALANFAELVRKQKFKTSMLSKDSDVIINLIVERMGTPDEKTIPVLLKLLEKPASKPKMSAEFAEKFEKAMAVFADEDNDDAQHALHVFEHLAGQKKLKPEILDLVILAIEKNKTNSVGTIAALCDILTSYGSSQDVMEALKYIIENYSLDSNGLDGHAAKPLKAMRALLDNPHIKLEMLKNLEDAKKFADAHKELDKSDAEILMNLAYALNILGEEKTTALYEKNGIVYFGRYTKSMLEEMHLTSTDLEYKKDRPLLVAVFNKNDWNNSFYYDAKALGKLIKYYRVVLFEADAEAAFYKGVEETEKAYGKIDSLVIAGHGTTKTVNLGSGWDVGDVDTSDEKDLEKLKGLFMENPNVILISCWGGSDETGIAALLSKLWNAKAWGDSQPGSLNYFKVDKNGKIIEPVYVKDTGNLFINGKLVEKPQK